MSEFTPDISQFDPSIPIPNQDTLYRREGVIEWQLVKLERSEYQRDESEQVGNRHV